RALCVGQVPCETGTYVRFPTRHPSSGVESTWPAILHVQRGQVHSMGDLKVLYARAHERPLIYRSPVPRAMNPHHARRIRIHLGGSEIESTRKARSICGEVAEADAVIRCRLERMCSPAHILISGI